MPDEGSAILFNGKGEKLELKKYPVTEEIDEEEVLVEITLATVCGSDVHTWLGHRPFPTPCILGHEMVGKIIKLGNLVKKDFEGNVLNVGDRIVWSMTVGCKQNDCFFCMNNLPQKCIRLFKYGHEKSDVKPYFSGGFAKYIILKKNSDIFKIPNELSDKEVSPLMCAGACVLNGLKLAKFSNCKYLIVQGCGALGLYACAFGKKLGAEIVIAIDKTESRLEMSKEFGVDYTILLKNKEQCIQEINDITKNQGADYVIEVTGDPSAIELGIDVIRVGGKYVLLGAIYPDSNFSVDSSKVIRNSIQIIGLHNYSPENLGMTLKLVSDTKSEYPYEKMVGPIFDFNGEGVEKAFQALDTKKSIRPAIIPK